MSTCSAGLCRTYLGGPGSSFSPVATIFSVPSGSRLWSAFASSQGARIQTSYSPVVVKMTGIAFGWTLFTSALGSQLKKPNTSLVTSPSLAFRNARPVRPQSGERQQRPVLQNGAYGQTIGSDRSAIRGQEAHSRSCPPLALRRGQPAGRPDQVSCRIDLPSDIFMISEQGPITKLVDVAGRRRSAKSALRLCVSDAAAQSGRSRTRLLATLPAQGRPARSGPGFKTSRPNRRGTE